LSISDSVEVKLPGYVSQKLPYSWLSGQFDTLNVSLVPVTNIGTEEWGKKVIEIAPNPSRGWFHLSGVEQGTYRLLDLSGRVLDSGVITNEQVQLGNTFANGNYVLMVESEMGQYRLPLVLLP